MKVASKAKRSSTVVVPPTASRSRSLRNAVRALSSAPAGALASPMAISTTLTLFVPWFWPSAIAARPASVRIRFMIPRGAARTPCVAASGR